MNAFARKQNVNKAREDMICLGAVFGAAGVRGAVRIKVFTEDIKSISEFGPVTIYGHEFPQGKDFQITILHNVKGGLAVKLKGVDDRNLAEALRGAELYIERSKLPKIEDDGGFYFEDLIGLLTKDQNGEVFGKVDGVFNFGAGDIIEVDLKSDKGNRMYPFSDLVVPEVNIEAGYIIINRDAFEGGESETETEQKG